MNIIKKTVREVCGEGRYYLKGRDFSTLKFQDERSIDINALEAKLAELEAKAATDNAYNLLQTLCDTKSQEAKNYINGAKVTSEQLARYEEKYEIAKAFKADGSHLEQLQLEADLVGLTVTELADLIIARGDAYKQALVTFNARIEAFRVKVRSLIADGQLDSVNLILETAKDFDITTTDDEIKALFV